ncbi:MAG TPA: DegT/DnrJ/EryC1/StrS family aminotransferase, partial [Chloroflexota bacterium]|nr:DegT/DnrJ/EryC1/StrS family aminotransferase [Chloroflexota bacterium]
LAIDGGPRAIPEGVLPATRGHGVQEIDQAEEAAVLDVLRRKAVFRWQDAEQSYVARFEAAVAQRTGSRFALALNSGTGALITALTAAGIGPGDEVIVPGYTFIASAAAVILCGAVPVIAEIDDTLTIDPDDVARKIGPYTRAIMPVHMRGIPSQMDRIMALAQQHDLMVVEDSAQANGGSFRGRALGAVGHLGCYSLQASKTITAGEGGVVLTSDPKLYARAALAHDSAMSFWRKLSSEHDLMLGDLPPIAGGGYRMSELQGAVAFTQVGKLDGILEPMRQAKREIAVHTADAPGITPMRVPDPDGECGLSVNYLLENAERAQRFARALQAEGVRVGTIHNEGFPDRHIYRYWEYVLNKTPISPNRDPWRDPRYKGKVEYSPDMCPRTLDILSRTVSVGLNQRLTEEHTPLIATAINKVARGLFA